MTRALIFDFDGLMIDSERVLAECIIEAVGELGAELRLEEIAHLFGTTEADREWELLLEARFARPFPISELEALVTTTVRGRVDELPLLPGVEGLLGVARDTGWRVGLATGQGRERLHVQLDRLAITSSFDAIVCSSEVARGKPAPDVFLAVADRLGLAPASCVVLEDSVPGCEAALAAGMLVVACPSTVTAHSTFPEGARRVTALTDVDLDALRDD